MGMVMGNGKTRLSTVFAHYWVLRSGFWVLNHDISEVIKLLLKNLSSINLLGGVGDLPF